MTGELGAAFGAPATTALAGKLQPKQPKQPPSPPKSEAPEPEGKKPAAADHAAELEELARTAAAEYQRGRRQDEQQHQTQDEPPATDDAPAVVPATFQVGVYLLPTAVAAAEKVRRRHSIQNAVIAFDALDAHRDELHHLVTQRKTAAAARPADSLFPSRPSKSTRSTAARQGRRQLWSLQATTEELAILDQLATDAGASSRSELISVAVEAFLLPKSRRRTR